jgi:hypothetical protein
METIFTLKLGKIACIHVRCYALLYFITSIKNNLSSVAINSSSLYYSLSPEKTAIK